MQDRDSRRVWSEPLGPSTAGSETKSAGNETKGACSETKGAGSETKGAGSETHLEFCCCAVLY